MELILRDTQSALTVSEITFGRDLNEVLVHQVVVTYVAGARRDTHAQKTRVEVTGFGRKPWCQKDIGRTYPGPIKSPIWRSGGMTFATHPQDHSQKVNKKMYRGVLKNILSELVCQDRLIVVEKSPVETPKTKLLAQKLKDMALGDVLIIAGELDEDLFLVMRSLYKVDVRDITGIDPVNLAAFDKVVVATDAAKQTEEVLA